MAQDTAAATNTASDLQVKTAAAAIPNTVQLLMPFRKQYSCCNLLLLMIQDATAAVDTVADPNVNTAVYAIPDSIRLLIPLSIPMFIHC